MLSTEEERKNLNISTASISSIKSDVVRQAAKTARNKENFNYLAGSQKLDNDMEVDLNEDGQDDGNITIGVMQYEDEQREISFASGSSSKIQRPVSSPQGEYTDNESGESREEFTAKIVSEDAKQVGSKQPDLDSSHLLGTV